MPSYIYFIYNVKIIAKRIFIFIKLSFQNKQQNLTFLPIFTTALLAKFTGTRLTIELERGATPAF
jgi:hypothetical protein